MRRLLLGLALAGCTASPRIGACPGTVVADLAFTATAQPGSACAFASSAPSSLSFPAQIAWGADGGAAHCVARPEAAPHTGVHDGGWIAVSQAFADVAIAGCSCAGPDGSPRRPTLTETVTGEVRFDGGTAVGFSGELRDDVAPPEGVDGGCGCGLPCDLSYALEAP